MELIQQNQVLVFTAAVFGIVFLFAVMASSVFARSARVSARLEKARDVSGSGGVSGNGESVHSFLARNVDERFFRLDETTRGNLRKELMRAGYFSRQALPLYLLIRVLSVLIIPAAGWMYISVLADGLAPGIRMMFVAVLVFLGFFVPKAFISFRQGRLEQHYRETFPDMMDVLLVCVDAGLSLEASIERVSREIGGSNRELGINLSLMTMEMRAGRGTIESLQRLAGRLGIDEAQSLATLLRQSNELGTSLSESLRVYSDEMRDKRMSRAEEKAHALPVKLVLPLALFIFPVILFVIMMPLVIRIMSVMG